MDYSPIIHRHEAKLFVIDLMGNVVLWRCFYTCCRSKSPTRWSFKWHHK